MEARHANEPARLDRIGATTSNPGVGERQRERIIRAALSRALPIGRYSTPPMAGLAFISVMTGIFPRVGER